MHAQRLIAMKAREDVHRAVGGKDEAAKPEKSAVSRRIGAKIHRRGERYEHGDARPRAAEKGCALAREIFFIKEAYRRKHERHVCVPHKVRDYKCRDERYRIVKRAMHHHALALLP